MKKSDVTCANCHAGYRRVELVSKKGTRGEFRCLVCDEVLEVFDGSTDVAMRLTVQPVLNAGVNPVSKRAWPRMRQQSGISREAGSDGNPTITEHERI